MSEAHADTDRQSHVIVDIGDGVGALLILTDASQQDREIELSPGVPHAERVHNVVRRRAAGDAPVYAALFPELSAGEYWLWPPGGAAPRPLTVAGGAVTEVRLG